MVARYLPEAKPRPQAQPRLVQHQVRQHRAAKQNEDESDVNASEVRWVTIVDHQ